MNAAPPVAASVQPGAPQPWPLQRLLTCTGLVFLTQVALIFALGERGATRPRPPAKAPVLRVVPQSGELLALTDPTLFALPHPEGFAGRAWLRPPSVQVQSRRPVEPPRWLSLAPEALGGGFPELARANRPSPLEVAVNPLPETPLPAQREPMPTPPSRSTLALRDGLEARRLLNPPELPAWPAADLLTNSVVRVLVNGDGLVRSVTLLGRSGSSEADRFAIEVARAARFEPLAPAPDAPPVQLGAMVFFWSTLPLTNAPSQTP